jgi:aryl-alcohol dehydrogenase-like predicted oxidoreductase
MTRVLTAPLAAVDAPGQSVETPASGVSTVRPGLRRLGESDLRVFPLAIGGNVFGWTADSEATDRILDGYRDRGGNFIDTADSYASGRSELMIGNWMRRRHDRADIVLATKVGKSFDNPGVSEAAIGRAVDASLARLQTDYIDLLYLHIDDANVPFEETLLAADEQVRAGKVRYLGVSDHSGNRMVEARVIAAQLELMPLVAMQSHYNLVHRFSYEGTIAHVAAQQRLGVMPRFGLAGGFLAGNYRTKADLGRHGRGADAARYLHRRGLRVLASLDRIAADHRVAPATVAIAWLLTKPQVVAPVVSASHPDQVADLVAATALQLTRHQVGELDRVSS